MEALYCPKCNLVNEVKIHSTNETYEVRGEKITILANVAVCKRCGEQIFHEELDSKNLDKVYREFRKRRAVLAPEQIKAIRTQYELSQRALGRLLKLGEITINRYESGSLPSDAHNELLILIEDPINVKKLLDRVGSDLNDKEEENLREKLDHLLSTNKRKVFLRSTEELLADYNPNVFSGFQKFSPEKFRRWQSTLLRMM